MRSGTYFVFALACFAACIWSILAVPETAGVSLEEIDKMFNSSAGRDDVDRRAAVFSFPPPESVAAPYHLWFQIETSLGLHQLLHRLTDGEDEEPEQE